MPARTCADDYPVKPFDKANLHARILVGPRVMAPQLALAGRIEKLEEGGRGDS
jgi:DNA-binding response OmpR family regulator